jgi:hypothetical protein
MVRKNKKNTRKRNGGGLNSSIMSKSSSNSKSNNSNDNNKKNNVETLGSRMENEKNNIIRAIQIIQKKRDNNPISPDEQKFFNSYLETLLIQFPQGINKQSDLSSAFLTNKIIEPKYVLFRQKLLDYLQKTFMSELRTGTSILTDSEKKCISEQDKQNFLTIYAVELENKDKYQKEQRQKQEEREKMLRKSKEQQQEQQQSNKENSNSRTYNEKLINSLREERMERDKINLMRRDYDDTISKLGYQIRKVTIPSFQKWIEISKERERQGLPEQTLNDWFFENQTNKYRERNLSPASKTIRKWSTKSKSSNKTAKIRYPLGGSNKTRKYRR